jgi:DNA-binding transcriptional MerR regulator
LTDTSIAAIPPAVEDSEGLLKISDLARITGVAVGTIRFYLREGLLPRPTLKTSRNMAYYDASFITRIQLVRKLKEERRLPLSVIRSLLSGDGPQGDDGPDLLELQARFISALDEDRSDGELREEEVARRTGISPEDLRDLCDLELIFPRGPRGRRRFSAQDAAVAETVARARALGLSRDLFPTSDLLLYRRALSELVGAEVSLFARRIKGRPLALPPERVLEAAINLMGDLIRHLRKRMILELLSGLNLGDAGALPAGRSSASRKTRR